VVGVGRSRVNKRATQSYTIATIQVPKLENHTYTSLDGNVFGSGLRRAHLRRADTPSSNGTRHRQERQELHWTRDHDVKGRFQGRLAIGTTTMGSLHLINSSPSQNPERTRPRLYCTLYR
jgi:hypothetical protein